MKTFTERDYITYPRRFKAYRWYKPLLVGMLFIVFLFIFNMAVEQITRTVFGATIQDNGYDSMDFYSAAGAFRNNALNACYIPSLLLAALIIKDRPISSYFSSMGGWRWKVFFRTMVLGIVVFAIPNIIRYILSGRIGEVRFTTGGFIMLCIFLPLLAIGEELLFRSFIMQTTGSWFNMAIVGLLAQVPLFALDHAYNTIGRISIGLSALVYGLICVYSKGIEASSVLHILNNFTGLLMAGLGFGKLTSEQSAGGLFINLFFKLAFFLFILYATKKLHWFDEVKKDDVTEFNEKSK